MPDSGSPRMASAALAAAVGVRYLAGDALARLQPKFDKVSAAEARSRGVLPVLDESGETLFVLPGVTDNELLGWLSVRTDGQVRWALGEREEIDRTLSALPELNQDSSTSGFRGRANGAAPVRTRSQSPVVAFVDRIVHDAWSGGASDIHIETRRDGLSVKFRLDGVLVTIGRWEGSEPPKEIVSRIKVMAGLDIAESRVPQDGRFGLEFDGRPVDFRVSIMPSAFGEDAVLRILDKRHLLGDANRMNLETLGFHGRSLAAIQSLARRPHGMLLVTGPTGSGKTTTLYAAISETLTGDEKVVTIEDPIEYELAGVLQIPVNERKGLTFSRGLRSILRHDPDKIFVGEIRDPETADIAVQSALTGHLVFTTVHANNVFDVLGRFLHMKVDPFSLMSALNGVVSQRLVRILCEHCAVADASSNARLQTIGLPAPIPVAARKPGGCPKCRHTGYAGRTAISEVLVVDDRFRELVVRHAPFMELKQHAAKISAQSMKENAIELVATGRTSLSEIERVLAFD